MSKNIYSMDSDPLSADSIIYTENDRCSSDKDYYSENSCTYSSEYEYSTSNGTDTEEACIAYAEQNFSSRSIESGKESATDFQCLTKWQNELYEDNIYTYIGEYEVIEDENINEIEEIYVTIEEKEETKQVMQKHSMTTTCLSIILNPHQLLFGWKSKIPWACQTTLRTWSRVLSTKMNVQFSVATSGNTATITFLRRTLKDYCSRAPNSIQTQDLLPTDFLSNIQTIFDMAKYKPTRFKNIIGIGCFPIHMSIPRSLWKDLNLLNSILTGNQNKRNSRIFASLDAATNRIDQLQHVITSYYEQRYGLSENVLRTFIADTGPNFRNMHPSLFALKALSSLAKRGQSVLLPEPCHPTLTVWFNVFQYSTGVEARFYRRNPKQAWILDFKDLQQKIDHTTAAVFFSNPAVMCGGISSTREMDILVGSLAKRNIPLIVEENMDYLVYDINQPSHSILELKPTIPVVVINSSYKWMIFGAKGPCLAWALTYDPHSQFPNRLFDSLQSTQNQSFKQSSELPSPTILSSILYQTSWTNDIVRYMAKNMSIASRILSETPGLFVTSCKAGYFLVILIDFENTFKGAFQNDTEFTTALFTEESVKTICGTLLLGWENSFALEMYMRRDLLIEACDRIDDFCRRHAKKVRV